MSNPASGKPSAKKVFTAARAIMDSEQQQDYLNAECGDDQLLKKKVVSLLVAAGAKTIASPLDALADAMGVEKAVLTSEPDASPDATTRPLPPELERQQIGPYKLLEQIGQGGFGTVYMAEQTAPVKRKVALKILKPGMDSSEVIARFEAERQALAMMDHPNIARVLDGGTTEQGRPYFVMELVRGVPVTEFCDEARSTTEERLQLFVDICRAIQHAHQKGIIHRDIKPSNVLVTMHDDKPVPKVIDFGIAKALSQRLTDRTLFTGYQQMLGTPAYMSPEQAQMSGIDIDTRSDVYSLGVLLYELLTGTTPFDKSSMNQISFDDLRKMIREQEPPRPSARITTMEAKVRSTVADLRRIDQRRVGEQLRGELDWIVMKALEKDRNRRYESASALVADVQRYLNKEIVQACPPSHWYHFSRWLRRNRLFVGTITVILTSLVIGLVSTTIQVRRAQRAEALAELRSEDERRARIRAEEEKARADRERRRADAEAARAVAAGNRAENEADIATAISDFLQNDLLAQIDLSNQLDSGLTPNPDITLISLLDRASQNIEGRFKDLPAVEGSLRYTLAQCYRSVGKYDKAMTHVQRAVEIGRSVIGADHPGTLRAICIQGDLARLQGDLKTAESLLLEAQRGIAANGGDDADDGLMVLGQLLVLRFDQGRHEEARSLALQLSKVCETTLGAESPAALTSLANLAIQLSALGDHAAAELTQRKVYETRLRILGPTHPDTLESIRNLAVLCDKRGEYEQAELLFQQVVDEYTTLLGADHPETLTAKTNLGHVLTRQGKLGEAEVLLQDTISRLEATLGKQHDFSIAAIERLAMVYELRRRLPESLELRESVLAARTEQLGEGHPRTISAQANFSGVLRKLRRVDEADEVLKRAINSARQSLGDQHPMTLTLLNNLAVSYFDAKNFTEALELFRNIEGSRLQKDGPDSIDLQSVRINIASVLQSLGQKAEARDVLQETLARLDAAFGESHPMTLEARKRLAEQLEVDDSLEDRYAQAELLHRRLVELNTNSFGLGHQDTLAALRRLVKNLNKQGLDAEATAFCQEQISTARELWGPSDRKTVDFQVTLAAALVTVKNFDAAEQLYREAYRTTRSLNADDMSRGKATASLVLFLNNNRARFDEAQQILEENIVELQTANAGESSEMRRMTALLSYTRKKRNPANASGANDTDDNAPELENE